MPTIGQSANAIEFSFDTNRQSIPDDSTLHAAAVSAGAISDDSEPASAVTSDVTAAPLTDTTPATDEPASSVTAEPAQSVPAGEPKTYTIKVDGRELMVTEKDLLEGHMRHRDYTQKTQRLADIEKDYKAREEKAQQELAALDQFLRDQKAIEAYVQRAFGQAAARSTMPQPQIDPSKPLTAADVAEIARYNADQVRVYTEQLVDSRVAETQQFAQAQAAQAQHSIRAAKVESEINAHLSALLDKYPALKKFEDIEDVLIADASKYRPKSVEDAKVRLADAAEKRAAILKAISEDEKKASAVAAAKLTKQGTEPPGGTAVKSRPGKKLTLDTKDRAALIDAAVADIQAMMGQ